MCPEVFFSLSALSLLVAPLGAWKVLLSQSFCMCGWRLSDVSGRWHVFLLALGCFILSGSCDQAAWICFPVRPGGFERPVFLILTLPLSLLNVWQSQWINEINVGYGCRSFPGIAATDSSTIDGCFYPGTLLHNSPHIPQGPGASADLKSGSLPVSLQQPSSIQALLDLLICFPHLNPGKSSRFCHIVASRLTAARAIVGWFSGDVGAGVEASSAAFSFLGVLEMFHACLVVLKAPWRKMWQILKWKGAGRRRLSLDRAAGVTVPFSSGGMNLNTNISVEKEQSITGRKQLNTIISCFYVQSNDSNPSVTERRRSLENRKLQISNLQKATLTVYQIKILLLLAD